MRMCASSITLTQTLCVFVFVFIFFHSSSHKMQWMLHVGIPQQYFDTNKYQYYFYTQTHGWNVHHKSLLTNISILYVIKKCNCSLLYHNFASLHFIPPWALCIWIDQKFILSKVFFKQIQSNTMHFWSLEENKNVNIITLILTFLSNSSISISKKKSWLKAPQNFRSDCCGKRQKYRNVKPVNFGNTWPNATKPNRKCVQKAKRLIWAVKKKKTRHSLKESKIGKRHNLQNSENSQKVIRAPSKTAVIT